MNIKSIFGMEKNLYVPQLVSVDDLGLGNSISSKSALSIASFWKGINIISNSIASLPIRTYINKTVLKEHESYFLLKFKPNDFQSSFEFINTMVLIMLLKGNSFAEIIRDDKGTVTSLNIISYTSVEALIFDGKLYYKFDGDKNKTLPNEDLIHFKNVGAGLLGEDIITNFKKNLEISINSTDYTNKVYTGEASSIRGTITYDKPLNDKQREVLRNELSTNFAGKGGKRILFLEDGMKLDDINLDPSQVKFLESREFEVSEIANMLNLPLFMLSTQKQTGTGIEQENIQFYQTTLLPLITKIEQELQLKLLTKKELIEGVYIKANVNALLRGDTKSRSDFYKTLFYLGSITPTEIRELEDMSSEVNGDTYLQANLIPSKIINRFWDAKARLDYSDANLNEKELENLNKEFENE